VLCVVILVNVNRAKDFAETRKHEQEMERQVMQNVRRMAHDTMSEKQDVRVSPSFFFASFTDRICVYNNWNLSLSAL